MCCLSTARTNLNETNDKKFNFYVKHRRRSPHWYKCDIFLLFRAIVKCDRSETKERKKEKKSRKKRAAKESTNIVACGFNMIFTPNTEKRLREKKNIIKHGFVIWKRKLEPNTLEIKKKEAAASKNKKKSKITAVLFLI